MLVQRVALFTLGLLLLTTSRASAYCRSTTCSGECPTDERGCKTEGKPLFWRTLCVGFSIQRDGTQWLSPEVANPIIRASFAAWADLECESGTGSISFAELSQVACHRSEYNADGPNANVVLWQDTRWTYKGADNNIAKTIVTFDDETGEILDADIEINHANNGFTYEDPPENCSENDCYDLQSVLTHEVGHFIGLDHTDDPSGTMNPSYDRATTDLRTLEPDDIEGACAAYPPDRVGQCDTQPKNGFTTECGQLAAEEAGCGCEVPGRGGPSGAYAACLGLLLAGAIHRRRSARALPRR